MRVDPQHYRFFIALVDSDRTIGHTYIGDSNYIVGGRPMTSEFSLRMQFVIDI